MKTSSDSFGAFISVRVMSHGMQSIGVFCKSKKSLDRAKRVVGGACRKGLVRESQYVLDFDHGTRVTFFLNDGSQPPIDRVCGYRFTSVLLEGSHYDYDLPFLYQKLLPTLCVSQAVGMRAKFPDVKFEDHWFDKPRLIFEEPD